MSARSAWVVLAASSITGCAGYTDVYGQPLTSASSGERSSQLPQVFLRGQPLPQRAFVELAILQARSSEALPDAVAALQEQAQRMGADALLDVRADSGAYEMSVIGTAVIWAPP